MTTTIEYRTIRDFPDYRIGIDKAVWSVPRQRPGKSGSVRTLPGKQLKPDPANRVWLTGQERRERHNVDVLWRNHFPEIYYRKHQTECRKGHPLLPFTHDLLALWAPVPPDVAVWGTGNRTCLTCHPEATPRVETTYSVQYGQGRPPEDWTAAPAPARPDRLRRVIRPGEDVSEWFDWFGDWHIETRPA